MSQTAATMTMNSPASLATLHALASSQQPLDIRVANAELMREVGLKCIGFNGVPRVINCLGAFRNALPGEVTSRLTTISSRTPDPQNIEAAKSRGRKLWDSIYRPFEGKLVRKLAESHPDLPVHILNSEYGLLFADPKRSVKVDGQSVGRIATSVVAVACLRAQTGVGPQVVSHVFGLRKAVEDGTWTQGLEEEAGDIEDGVRWLASDEGSCWILESVDAIVNAIGDGSGSSFAPLRAKL